MTLINLGTSQRENKEFSIKVYVEKHALEVTKIDLKTNKPYKHFPKKLTKRLLQETPRAYFADAGHLRILYLKFIVACSFQNIRSCFG